MFCSLITNLGSSSEKVIIKKYTNIFSEVWFKIPLSKLAEYILKYNDCLNNSGIITPKLYGLKIKEEEIEITQELIAGKSIRDKLKSNTEDISAIHKSIKYFENLIRLQAYAYNYSNNLRIDLNPDNFIINESGVIYYIDITPPLFTDIIDNKGQNIILTRYLNLCFCICSQIGELINNWLKPLIKSKDFLSLKPSLEQLDNFLDLLVSVATEVWQDSRLEKEIKTYFSILNISDDFNLELKNYPLNRLKLIKLLCYNKITLNTFYKKYAAFSLTKGL